MQQKQEYEAQMALSIGGQSSGYVELRNQGSMESRKSSADIEENANTQKAVTASEPLQNQSTDIPLPQPISQLKGQRVSQDSDKTDASYQSCESDRIILESNEDEDEDDEDDDEIVFDNKKIFSDSKESYDKNLSKNIEIRRMSSTEDGNKVLNSEWQSPEKEKLGKTPLEMVQNIVSSIEAPKEEEDNMGSEDLSKDNLSLVDVKEKCRGRQQDKTTSKHSTELVNNIPAWLHGSGKPMMHSQQIVANQTPPTTIANALNQPTPQPPMTTISQTFPGQPQQASINPGQIQSSIPMVTQPGSQMIFTPATSQSQNMMTTVQMSSDVGQQPQSQNPQPPIMQIVNTVNGPMLMQAFPAPTGITNVNQVQSGASNVATFPAGGAMVIPTTDGCFQPQQVTSIHPLAQHQVHASIPGVEIVTHEDENENDCEGLNVPKDSKKKRKGKKKKIELPIASQSQNHLTQYQPQVTLSQQGQMPILVSPSTQASPSPQAIQPLIMNQSGPVLTNVNGQVLLSNGSFMTVPTIYNQQMADGSIVQVQNGIAQIPSTSMIQQGAQPMIAGNGAGPILMNPQGGGQFVPSGGTFIMTPQGLVPATPAGMPPNAQPQPVHSQPPFPHGNFVAISPAAASNQPLQQITISPAHTPTLIQQPTPPPTQIPPQQQVLAVQHQQAIASTSMSIKLHEDNSGEDNVSMSPPSARSTPIPSKINMKRLKKKKGVKNFRNHHKKRNRNNKVIEMKEVKDEHDRHNYGGDTKERYEETEDTEDEEDSDIEEIIEDSVLDEDDISDENEAFVSVRSRTESSRSSSPAENNIASSSNPKSKLTHQQRSKSSKGSKVFIQSNKVDSSGRKATPPHSADDKLSCCDLFRANNAEDSLDTSGASTSSGGSVGNITVNQPSSSRSSRKIHRTSTPTQKKKKRNADILLQEQLVQEESEGKLL